MERFDVLVIGSGSGMIVASTAVEQGFKTAVVENGTPGGHLLQPGGLPSQKPTYPAGVVTVLKEAKKLGVNATVNSIDFKSIMERMHTLVNGDSSTQARAVE